MTERLRQKAACDASVAADMTPFRTVPMPVQITDETHPNIAAAAAILAAMSPEKRAQLLGEWE